MTELDLKLPKLSVSREFTIKGKTTRDTGDGTVPEEIQNYAASVVGDGKARVALSGDLSVKDFGNGCSASVTISLSCHQDDQTINHVVQTLGVWVRGYARQQFDLIDAEYQKMKASQESFGSNQ